MFGSRDGYTYCLNATDGALRWRFLAASQDKRTFNFEQLEFTTNNQRFALQQEHMEGKHGALLKILDKSGGRDLSSMEIQSMPVFDGMILAAGRVYMSTVDGTVSCFAVE